jgi:hypothetical protein
MTATDFLLVYSVVVLTMPVVVFLCARWAVIGVHCGRRAVETSKRCERI